jgi:hypothetical protein
MQARGGGEEEGSFERGKRSETERSAFILKLVDASGSEADEQCQSNCKGGFIPVMRDEIVDIDP